MDPEQLWETTLDPKTRILRRVTIDDARLASEITSQLMGNDVVPRKAFIQKYAHEANIDV